MPLCFCLLQIAELQTEVNDLKLKLEDVLKEKENMIGGRVAEVAKVRHESVQVYVQKNTSVLLLMKKRSMK